MTRVEVSDSLISIFKNERILMVERIDIANSIIHLSDGAERQYDFIFIAAGSWVKKFINLPVKIEKRVLAWFKTKAPVKGVTGFTHGGAEESLYGMPGVDGLTYKIGDDAQLNELQPPDGELVVHERDQKFLTDCAKKYLVNLDTDQARFAACKYTLTENGGFLIDRHPEAKNLVFFSCCSGHGFKYAPVYGEIAMAFLKDQEAQLNIAIDEFSLRKQNILLC